MDLLQVYTLIEKKLPFTSSLSVEGEDPECLTSRYQALLQNANKDDQFVMRSNGSEKISTFTLCSFGRLHGGSGTGWQFSLSGVRLVEGLDYGMTDTS